MYVCLIDSKRRSEDSNRSLLNKRQPQQDRFRALEKESVQLRLLFIKTAPVGIFASPFGISKCNGILFR